MRKRTKENDNNIPGKDRFIKGNSFHRRYQYDNGRRLNNRFSM